MSVASGEITGDVRSVGDALDSEIAGADRGGEGVNERWTNQETDVA